MAIEGIIILILAMVALLGMGIFFGVWGHGFQYPEGFKLSLKKDGRELLIFIDKNIPNVKSGGVQTWLVGGIAYKPSNLLDASMKSWELTEKLFNELKIGEANIKKYVIVFQTDEHYEEGTLLINSAAYTGNIPRRMWGTPIPAAFVRSKHMKTLCVRGQPVIHELIHTLNNKAGRGFSSNHKDPLLWEGAGKYDSLEYKTTQAWKNS